MKKAPKATLWLCVSGALLLASGVVTQPALAAVNPDPNIYLVREIELSEQGLQGPVGLAYSPQADVLMAVEGNPGQPDQKVFMMDRIERLQGESHLDQQLTAPLAIAFDQRFNGLYVYQPASQALLKLAVNGDGKLPRAATTKTKFDLQGLGVQNAAGMDFHPKDGRLFFLDPAGKRLLIVTPDDAGDYSVEKAKRDGRLKTVDLQGIGENHLAGLAINPNTGNIFTLGRDNQTLYEVNENGDLVDSSNVSVLGLKDLQGMVFAPSGDSTDRPEIQSLYLADPGRNSIMEVSIAPAQVMPLLAPSPVSLTDSVLTSAWNPPSPDPVGIEYRPSTNTLMVVDSEVDEMSIFQGVNVYETSLTGALISTCSTSNFPSNDPNGIGINPGTGHFFITDDGENRIFEVNLGRDGKYCTRDDRLTSIDTMSFGSSDPEGVTFANGNLVFSDGLNAEIYVVSPGRNKVFDGAAPNGDDQYTHFDTTAMGLRDPEGVGYHPGNGTIFIVSRPDSIMIEASLSGDVLRLFDISFLNARAPGGVGLGPGSRDPSAINVYIAARGVDNNTDPNENDGKIYELNIGDTNSQPPTITPSPTPGPPPGPFRIYLALISSGVGILSFARDEDILAFDGTGYSMFFDGSDVGLSTTSDVDFDGVSTATNEDLCLSTLGAFSFSDVSGDGTNVFTCQPSSLGPTTACTFQPALYFRAAQME